MLEPPHQWLREKGRNHEAQAGPGISNDQSDYRSEEVGVVEGQN
jgi:hypothetical protein